VYYKVGLIFKCKFYDSHENITSSTTLHSAIFQPKNINKKLNKLFDELYKQGNNVAPQVLSTRLLKKKIQKTILHGVF